MCEDDNINNITMVDDSQSFNDTVITVFFFIFGALCITCCIISCNNSKKS